MKQQVDAVIIGAGITGLCTAYRLHAAGKRVLIIDSSPHPGGVIQSTKVDKYLIEQGPHTVLLSPEIKQLLQELNLEQELVYPDSLAKNRYLSNRCSGNSLLVAPHSLREFVTTELLPLSTKVRVLAEPFLARTHTEDDISVQDFFARHFGSFFTEEIVATALNGIWAADISRLSARSALPQLWKLAQEHRSLILAQFKQKPRPAKRRIFSLKGGLNQLTARISAALPADSRLYGSTVDSLTLTEGGAEVGTSCKSLVTAAKVYLCVDAQSTATLLQEIEADLARMVAQVPHAPLGISHLVVPRSACTTPWSGFGFLCSASTNRKILGGIFSSALFPERAPQEQLLLSIFSGGARQPEMANCHNENIQRELLRDVTELLRLEQQPTFLAGSFWSRAVPNYALGHHRLLSAVRTLERQRPQLSIQGNWLDGIGLPDRVRSAFAATAPTS